MNPQRDRGIRTEREACALLLNVGGWTVNRRKNEGIPEDIGDLIGVPDCTIQVSRCRDDLAAINNRARTKLAAVELQRQRAGTTHSVVLLRIDGAGPRPGVWRALIDSEQMLRYEAMLHRPMDSGSNGWIIRHAPDKVTGGWHWVGANRFVATVETWAADHKTALLTRTNP